MTEGRRTVISPAVERAAAERGISSAELAAMRGSGRGGRLLVADLPERGSTALPAAPRTAAGPPPSARREAPAVPAPTVVVPVTVERSTRIERTMRDAWSSAALTSAVEVDVTPLMRAAQTGGAGARDATVGGAVVMPALMLALGRTLAAHPAMNARIDVDAGVVEYRDRIDLRLVSSGQAGDSDTLIQDCGALDAQGVVDALAGARLLARAGEQAALGMQHATFTLFDRSTSEILFETVPLAEGTTGALSVGRVERRPLSVADDDGGGFRVAWATYLCLTYDHRLVDGADAARFLSELAEAAVAQGVTAG